MKGIEEYKIGIKEIGFEEMPFAIGDRDPALKDVIPYNEMDHELKIYITQMLICRSFPVTGGIILPSNVEWFINEVFNEFKSDLIEPWRSHAIKKAITMISSEDTFGDSVIATTFMYGVIEFYAKSLLGFKPREQDNESIEKYRKVGLGSAIQKLKKSNLTVAKSLNWIDKRNIESFKEKGLFDFYKNQIRVSDRLSGARNIMLHGEAHNFYSEGEYLVMLYILFHLHTSSHLKMA